MSNPMFRNNMCQEGIYEDGAMTVSGSIKKTLFLVVLALITATYTWDLTLSGFLDKVSLFMYGGLIVGFISVIIASFKPHLSNIFAPIYALAEGLALGAISAMYNSFYNGIIIQAVVATMLTLGAMLFLYMTRLVQATETFKRVVFTSTLAIGIFYMIVIIGSVFHIGFLSPFMSAYNNIFVIAFIVVIAALNLIRDFDFIEKGAQYYMPKHFEWYGAMGLMVTLVWLYIEILRLLASAKRR